MSGADLAAARIGRRLHRLKDRLKGTAAPPDKGAAVACLLLDQGQVTSISKGLFSGVIGLAMSTPVAVPVIL